MMCARTCESWNDAGAGAMICARCIAEMKRASLSLSLSRVHYKVAPCKVSVGLRVDPGAPYSIYNLIFCGCDMCAAHKVTSPGPCLAWGSELVRHTYRGSNVCALFHRKQIRKIISLCSREQPVLQLKTRGERALPMPFWCAPAHFWCPRILNAPINAALMQNALVSGTQILRPPMSFF